MLATVSSATLLGVRGYGVTVEVHVSIGLPGFTVVGLPDASCREARDRVRAAVLSSELPWPGQRITVNLAPSGIPKSGAGLDLAVAIGVLVAAKELDPEAVAGRAFLGELGLDGAVRPVPGALPLAGAIEADEIVLSGDNVHEVATIDRHRVRGVSTLKEVVAALRGDEPWPEPPAPNPDAEIAPFVPDLSDVRGQGHARQALEIAAAGGHHILLMGSPGAGKTMLAKRMPGLLPPLDSDTSLETTCISSAAGERLPPGGLVTIPPFRAPHHGVSTVAMVGGGSRTLRPGEISLAHGGVLFLDELGEFSPVTLDALRQPLEEGVVRVSRAAASATLPARFLLIGAMNPCPCGHGDNVARCRCTPAARARYARRLSGPLVDRFDLRIRVQRPDVDDLLGCEPAEPTAAIAERVAFCRSRASERGVRCNADLEAQALDDVAPLHDNARLVLEGALSDERLTARGLARIRRVALTIADLAGDDVPITDVHVAQALTMRASLEPALV